LCGLRLQVWFMVMGEMGRSLFRHPGSYMKLISKYRGTLARGKVRDVHAMFASALAICLIADWLLGLQELAVYCALLDMHGPAATSLLQNRKV
jgi:hypothetical protein